ncbi:MAG TPA: AAA family ATPase [Spongiibacteraceae bacterium]|nr:AAA family ATPase [Spongiibacteraceae bacterium]
MDDKTLYQALSRPQAYPHPVTDILYRETHISQVFLTDQYAYKVKKARDLGFLDFSTLAQRKWFCEEELRLNRRFAPQLYLDVVSINRTAAGLQIDGAGEVVDYAVKMRRFDDDQLLSKLAARGELTPGLVRGLARHLAELQGTLPSCYPERGAGTPVAFYTALEQSIELLASYRSLPREARDRLEQVGRWARTRYADQALLMKRRLREGRVKDGHGDLHLGNIVLIEGEPVLFDCIEFNADFRINDSMAELAFLSMDLGARGLAAASQRVVNDYLEYSGDYSGAPLLDLFRCHYALVRAKVTLLRDPADAVGDDTWAETLRYLHLAEGYTRAVKPRLVLMHGVSGSGKSTVAGQLADAMGAIRLRSDVERKRLAGLAPEAASSGDIYTPAMGRATFDRLRALADTLLAAGLPVIVDATFLRCRDRQRFAELAVERRCALVIVACDAEPAELERRISARRNDASEASIEVMHAQRTQREWPGADEADELFALDVADRPALDALLAAMARPSSPSSR